MNTHRIKHEVSKKLAKKAKRNKGKFLRKNRKKMDHDSLGGDDWKKGAWYSDEFSDLILAEDVYRECMKSENCCREGKWDLTDVKLGDWRGLRGIRFDDFDLTRMSADVLIDCVFHRCKLQENNFEEGLLDYFFSDCELTDVVFSGSPNSFSMILLDCKLQNCTFDTGGHGYRFRIENSEFVNCSFKRVYFAYSDLKSSRFENCDFTRANMPNSTFIDTQFINCKFKNMEYDFIPPGVVE